MRHYLHAGSEACIFGFDLLRRQGRLRCDQKRKQMGDDNNDNDKIFEIFEIWSYHTKTVATSKSGRATHGGC
jgi:hypothetical protein